MRRRRLRDGNTEICRGTSFDGPDPAGPNRAGKGDTIAEPLPEQKPPDESNKIHLTASRQR
jgi:hypothetical protein